MYTSRELEPGLLEAVFEHARWEELELCKQFNVDAEPRFAVACPAMRPHDPIYDSVSNLVQSNVSPHVTGTQVDTVSSGIVEATAAVLPLVAFEEVHSRYWDTIQLGGTRYESKHVLSSLVLSSP